MVWPQCVRVSCYIIIIIMYTGNIHLDFSESNLQRSISRTSTLTKDPWGFYCLNFWPDWALSQWNDNRLTVNQAQVCFIYELATCDGCRFKWLKTLLFCQGRCTELRSYPFGPGNVRMENKSKPKNWSILTLGLFVVIGEENFTLCTL